MTITEEIQAAFKHCQAGEFSQAEQICRNILGVEPENVDVLYLLGVVCFKEGVYGESVELSRKILRLQPEHAGALNNLGNVCQEKGDYSGAKEYYRQAIDLDPEYADAYHNLGNLYHDIQQFDQAIICYQKAREINPDFAEVYNSLGNMLLDGKKYEEAACQYKYALALKPDFAEAYYNLGNVYRALDYLEESLACFRKAVEINPGYIDAYNNMGVTLRDVGQPSLSLSCYRRAIEIDGVFAEAHWNLSLSLLLLGEMREGFREYEWRRQVPGILKPRDYSQPLWDGSNLGGRRILLYTEQGYGDAIQFIRYVPEVVKRGGHVILECQRELFSLFKGVEGISELVLRGESLPSFDIESPLLSLPYIMGTEESGIPSSVPYLSIDEERKGYWRERMRDDDSRLKVGIAWAGKPTHKRDRERSLPLAAILPLLKRNGISFYSLQKGDSSAELANLPSGLRIVDWSGELVDFGETAALLSNLDLTISADTAVAHLAGALALPVWIFLPYSPDWRWFLQREDTPWYPTMRLIRQKNRGDWPGVIRDTELAIAGLLKGRS